MIYSQRPCPRVYKMASSSGDEIVYELLGSDYGESYEYYLETGIKHIPVTEDPTGDYPGYPCPEFKLTEVFHS